MATIEERLAALEALLGMSEGETPYVSQYSGPDIDEGIELARSGTVRKTGGTMTGNLTVEKSTPIINLNDTAAGTGGRFFSANNRVYAQTANVNGSDANRRQLVLANSAAVDKTRALALHDIVDGALSAYYLYGEHNKPTPAAIGAVAKAGDTMTGDLTISKAAAPVVALSNTTTGRTLRINAGGDNTAGIYNRKDSNNITGLFLRAEKDTPDDAVAIQHTYNGVSKYYNVLHTGNMDSLISSLRIATGTYTGTGTYGGSVTLTCGFKPAFAIIYREGTTINVASAIVDMDQNGNRKVESNWTEDFVILIPGTTTNVYYGNTVSVESGDTYLKFTPSGTNLNGAITYNYIIVGS